MRILVSVADVDSKRLTKVAKVLKKHWPLAPITLMQAQNLLASVMGYRDLHDLQGRLLKYIPSPVPSYSRTSVRDALSWTLFRTHKLSFDQAHDLANLLPLKLLDFDAQTLEAKSEAKTKELAAKGMLLMMDEFGSYMAGADWFEHTPELLQAGAPAYKFVILPNGRAVRWSRITTLADRLPDDLVNRLRTEGRYKAIKDDNEVLVAFYRDELLPGAPEPLRVAIEQGRELPLGFEIKKFGFDKKGLVLQNTELGGVIPIVFHHHSRRVFDATANLMQGLPVELEDNAYIVGSDGLWELPGEDETPINEQWWMSSFLTSSHASSQPGVAKTFTERGQQYSRTYEWLDMDSVPAVIADWYEMTNPVDQPPSELAVPVWHQAFHDRTQQLLNAKTIHAKERIIDAVRDGRLLALINKYALQLPLACLDYLPLVTRMHTSEPDPHWEMTQAEIDEDQKNLDDALAHYRELGGEIAKEFSALAHLGNLALGYLWYMHHGETFGSRDDYQVPHFASRHRNDIHAYLSFLAFHFCTQRVSSSVSNHSSHGGSDAMRIALDLVLTGKLAEDRLTPTFFTLTFFIDSFERQKKHLGKIDVWRAKMDRVDQVRAGGEYLYARDRVSPVKEESWLSKSFREGRKYGGTVFTGVQDLSDFGEVAGLAALFAQARSLSLESPPESVLGPNPFLEQQQSSDDTAEVS
jgi:hypothetical protein